MKSRDPRKLNIYRATVPPATRPDEIYMIRLTVLSSIINSAVSFVVKVMVRTDTTWDQRRGAESEGQAEDLDPALGIPNRKES